MPDAASAEEIDPSDVQRIRDALAELRRLDEEMIAAWRELREIQLQSEQFDRSKVPPRRWFNSPGLEIRLNRFSTQLNAWTAYVSATVGVVIAVWLACTDGPVVPGRITQGSESGRVEVPKAVDSEGPRTPGGRS
jgi:hypothetical protein